MKQLLINLPLAELRVTRGECVKIKIKTEAGQKKWVSIFQNLEHLGYDQHVKPTRTRFLVNTTPINSGHISGIVNSSQCGTALILFMWFKV